MIVGAAGTLGHLVGCLGRYVFATGVRSEAGKLRAIWNGGLRLVGCVRVTNGGFRRTACAPKAVVSVVAAEGRIDPKPRFSGRQHRPPMIHKREPKERYTIAMSAISNRRGGLARRMAGSQTASKDVSGRRGCLVAELFF